MIIRGLLGEAMGTRTLECAAVQVTGSACERCAKSGKVDAPF